MNQFAGIAHQTALFLQREHLLQPELWRKFVDVYRSQPDGENMGWRGEFWGKMMRGATLVYEYTRDDALYKVLSDSVCDLLTVAEPDGRVSSYTRDTELDAWDLWGRKYVLLGCEYFLEICRDDALRSRVITFLGRCADCILEKIGPDRKPITHASRSWYGLNSSSILEPMVRLYRLTGESRYLEFAEYIVKEGGAQGINVFQLALENRLYPYQYGVSKAYEMTSCFEGLLEYYRITGIERYKTAVLNYAKAVLASEISIIGSSGVTHELFDHTRTRQTVRYDGVMQETCVTVTLMNFFARLLDLTHDSAYADAMEQAFYNAYLGALNTEHRESPYVHQKFADRTVTSTILPFDSYSPLTPGRRGQKVGGNQLLPDGSYYGCCACIGAAGVGIWLKKAIVADESSITVNFYERGQSTQSIGGVPVTLTLDTAYPVDGRISIRISAPQPVSFALRLRNPGWSNLPRGYTVYEKAWHEDTLELVLDMPICLHRPLHWERDLIYTDTSKNTAKFHAAGPVAVTHRESEDHYISVTRGPLTLAADSRTGKAADSIFVLSHSATQEPPAILPGVPCLLKLKFAPPDGDPFYLVDYAHAGRDWSTLIAAWLPTK